MFYSHEQKDGDSSPCLLRLALSGSSNKGRWDFWVNQVIPVGSSLLNTIRSYVFLDLYESVWKYKKIRNEFVWKYKRTSNEVESNLPTSNQFFQNDCAGVCLFNWTYCTPTHSVECIFECVFSTHSHENKRNPLSEKGAGSRAMRVAASLNFFFRI
jgi:hypothetical protein